MVRCVTHPHLFSYSPGYKRFLKRVAPVWPLVSECPRIQEDMSCRSRRRTLDAEQLHSDGPQADHVSADHVSLRGYLGTGKQPDGRLVERFDRRDI